MIFLSVKFEKEACLVVNITDFSPSKFFSLHRILNSGRKSQWTIEETLKLI